MLQKVPSAEFLIADRQKDVKKEEHFYENVRSLMCPTCGKVHLNYILIIQ